MSDPEAVDTKIVDTDYNLKMLELATSVAATAASYNGLNTKIAELTGLTDEQVTSLLDTTKAFGALATAASLHSGIMNDLIQKVPLLGGFTADLITKQYEVAASFNKATSTGGEYRKAIQQITIDLTGYGLTAEDVVKNTSALFDGFTDFSLGSEKAQTSLGVFVNKLAATGISSMDVVSSLQNLTKGYAETAEEAQANILGLDAFALASHQSSAKVMADFTAQSGRFAIFGDKGVDAFKKLSAAAKSTGASMEGMLAVTDKFDTFESAATSVGSLNSILGGSYLNSVELVMETDPTERMKMLKRAFEEAGVSVENLGYYQKKAFMNVVGITDASEFVKTFTGDMDKLADSTGQAGTEMDDLQARALAQMKPRDAEKALISSAVAMANLVPVVETLTADGFKPLISATDGLSDQFKLMAGKLLEQVSPGAAVDYASGTPLPTAALARVESLTSLDITSATAGTPPITTDKAVDLTQPIFAPGTKIVLEFAGKQFEAYIKNLVTTYAPNIVAAAFNPP